MAPGFQIENVFVLAGVPKIMQAMLEDVASAPCPRHASRRALASCDPACRKGVSPRIWPDPERHPEVSIGSYPFFSTGGSLAEMRASVGTTLVVRGRDDAAEVEAAAPRSERSGARSWARVPERNVHQLSPVIFIVNLALPGRGAVARSLPLAQPFHSLMIALRVLAAAVGGVLFAAPVWPPQAILRPTGRSISSPRARISSTSGAAAAATMWRRSTAPMPKKPR